MAVDPQGLILHRPSAEFFSYHFNGKVITFPAQSQHDALRFLEELGAHLSQSKLEMPRPQPRIAMQAEREELPSLRKSEPATGRPLASEVSRTPITRQ